MTITPGRLVALLTPLVFAPLAGAIAVTAAKYFPGVDLDPDRLQEVFIAGALIAFGKAGIWLKGWQDYERRQDPLPEAVANDFALEGSMLSGTAASAGMPENAAGLGEDADDDELADGSDLDEDDRDLLDEDDFGLAPAAGRR